MNISRNFQLLTISPFGSFRIDPTDYAKRQRTNSSSGSYSLLAWWIDFRFSGSLGYVIYRGGQYLTWTFSPSSPNREHGRRRSLNAIEGPSFLAFWQLCFPFPLVCLLLFMPLFIPTLLGLPFRFGTGCS